MEAACFSEMLASANQSTWRLNPKEYNQNINHDLNTDLFRSSTAFCGKTETLKGKAVR
jgi:hypothetical protein